MAVLECLIERPGRVVSRQELIDRVWKEAFVTDTSLAEAVSFLRQALGDDPQNPRYIQTLHRRGYRFVATVEPDAEPGPSTGPPDATSGNRRPEVKPSIGGALLPP
jgi:DNA-binding winged helix-turn-helix (wHTH) protein